MYNKIREDLIIRETRDYDMFNKLLGNREVTDKRVCGIKESILRVGYHPSPILVNENYEVIDGQGRLEALRQLDIPVLYIRKDGLSIDDCISMNIKMKNWSVDDYIKSWADRGNVYYETLAWARALCPNLDVRVCVVTLSGIDIHTAQIKNGKFECGDITEEIYMNLQWLNEIKRVYKVSQSTLVTLSRLLKFGLIEPKRMYKSIARCEGSGLRVNSTKNDAINTLNDIYNAGYKKKVYFADQYRMLSEQEKALRKKA